MRQIGRPVGRNNSDRTSGTEKIKTESAMRAALKDIFAQGLGATIAEKAGLKTEALKPFVKGNGALPNGAFGRLRDAIRFDM